KADDAVDYEDISDDDLADDEELIGEDGANGHGTLDGDEDVDLFGEVPDTAMGEAAPQGNLDGDDGNAAEPDLDDLFGEGTSFRDVDYGKEEDDDDPELREQRELFAQAEKEREDRLRNGGVVNELPPALQTDEDVFKAIWPNFKPGSVLRFGELLPHRRAYYVAKAPLKPPKPVQPTKVNLDIAQDQEKLFKLPPSAPPTGKARQTGTGQQGVVSITEAESGEKSTDEEFELEDFDDKENFGGVTGHDIQILCDDWDISSQEDVSLIGQGHITISDSGTFSFKNDWNSGAPARPNKKRRTLDSGTLPIFQDKLPSFDDPEAMTAKLARKVNLDMNDPELLIDIQQPDSAQKKTRNLGTDFRRDVSGSLTKSMFRRYNISNDEGYDLLKQNHREKVRNVTNINTLDHSLPALKLQYPFYKVKLSSREARSFHRPSFNFVPNQLVKFNKPNFVKHKKQFKGQDPKTLFATSADLSLADNSNMTLFEYSEEYPMMMSNFGMCNRLINYYRRKDNEDKTRPKGDIGEPVVLYPEDQSPFAIFGNVEPGQTVPTLHNSMYRAPVFNHEVKSTDFLVIRSTTGTNGSQWYLRNVENLFVVGQQFPSTQVPGTHSRRVTEAGKKRLKMISYRIYARNAANKARGPMLSNDMIKEHLPGSDIAQNRGKMREFMAYDKENQSWRPKPGETIPDEAAMRNWIKPEDICLIDSMQVGHRHLQDAGYNKEGDDGDEEEDDEKEGQSLEVQLAPWNTTKNFLEASSRRAMLELHGEGDPSGRGEAISMIKTSMKGGFKPVGESVKDKLDAKKMKDLGGHSYNVAMQQKAYDEAIQKIWEAQKNSLSSTIEHSDVEMDIDDPEEAGNSFNRARTPQSQYGTPATFGRQDDDTMSHFSRVSANSQNAGKTLKIRRTAKNRYGEMETTEEIIHDSRVIRAYTRARRQEELESLNLTDLKPTGDSSLDARQIKRLQGELERLQRNRERRHVREKAKGTFQGGDPSGPGGGGGGKGANTTRRCANCGQVGHIKTNKK
ncbi:hypothetical protein K490DRAFT_13473, partial [Saccharata proteae CBS 121410]